MSFFCGPLKATGLVNSQGLTPVSTLTSIVLFFYFTHSSFKMSDLQEPKTTDLHHHLSTDGSTSFIGTTPARILERLFVRPSFMPLGRFILAYELFNDKKYSS